jgi:hypothetical protein
MATDSPPKPEPITIIFFFILSSHFLFRNG